MLNALAFSIVAISPSAFARLDEQSDEFQEGLRRSKSGGYFVADPCAMETSCSEWVYSRATRGTYVPSCKKTRTCAPGVTEVDGNGVQGCVPNESLERTEIVELFGDEALVGCPHQLLY
jgi:hypothetical protein